jgi:hypothetical protein
MLQFGITTTPSGRVLVSMFLPEDVVEGYPLGTLIADLDCLEQFGLDKAAITECKQSDFVSAKVGPESSKYAGTSIGQNQVLGDILGMGVTSIAVIVRRREVPATLPTRSLMDALRRSPVLTFPEWGGGGNKAYGDLYTALKAKLELSGFTGTAPNTPKSPARPAPQRAVRCPVLWGCARVVHSTSHQRKRWSLFGLLWGLFPFFFLATGQIAQNPVGREPPTSTGTSRGPNNFERTSESACANLRRQIENKFHF